MAKSAVRFKDTVATYDALVAEVKARRFAPVYLLMGEESYFIDSLAELLSETVLEEAARAFSQYTVYGRDVEAGQVVNLCRQMPMVGSHQVVIVKEAQQMSKAEKLSLYVENPSPSTLLVLCYKGKTMDKRTAFYKWAAKSGAVLESVRPYESEISGWLSHYVASQGCAIDAKALSMFTDYLGADISKIVNELKKLLLSLPEGTKRITDAHIEQNIGISKEFNNFELCKAVLSRNMGRALQIADQLNRNPRENPTLLTILALFTQFKTLFLYNYLLWQARNKGIPVPPDQELYRLLKSNYYALQELKQAAPLWPNKKVFSILGLLREYDAKSKGLGAGSISEGELRRELILKLFML